MKTLKHWNPFNQLIPLTHGVAGLRRKEFVVPAWLHKEQAYAFYQWRAGMEVEENREAVIITFLLEGAKKNQVQIHMDQRHLTVTAKRQWSATESDWSASPRKTELQTFEKKVLLPPLIDRKGITSRFEKGRLSIVLPKLNPEEKELEIG